VVADKGYHSNEALRELHAMKVRTYIAEPERGRRNSKGRPAEKQAVYANRRRIWGDRGKQLQARRGERIERNFAHQFDTGGMHRLYVRGRMNVHKKLLIQAPACNLALLMRAVLGAGKPKAAQERLAAAMLTIVAVIQVSGGDSETNRCNTDWRQFAPKSPAGRHHHSSRSSKTGGLDPGC
jgi:transposase